MVPMQIIAAADGSSLGNPGPAGWAWYVDDSTWRAGGWPRGTNNQGELMAVLDLLEQTADKDADLRILCDSQYVINSVTKWMPGWKRKGWKKSDGKPVQNRELLEGIDEALAARKADGHRVDFEWVRGHAGHDLNEAADERARGAAEAFQRGAAPNEGPGFGGASLGDAGSQDAASDAPEERSAGAELAASNVTERGGAQAALGMPDNDFLSGERLGGQREEARVGGEALALFDDDDFLSDVGDDLTDDDADAATVALLKELERDEVANRRAASFRQFGVAARGKVSAIEVSRLAPGVALVTSSVDGADRTYHLSYCRSRS